MLDKYLDPADTFWTSLENKPISRLSGIFQKKRGCTERPTGCTSHLARKTNLRRIKIAGRRSEQGAEANPHAKLKPAGADWWLARSARAALTALHLSGGGVP